MEINKKHLNALDAIRFLAAFIVVVHHLPRFSLLPPASKYVFFGPSAVMAFFIISGLCIHISYLGNIKINLMEYYTRRYIRLLLPLSVVLIISLFVDVSYSPYHGWVTWSLICEAVYYAVYPALRGVWSRWGWRNTLLMAYGLSFAILALTINAESSWQLGVRDSVAYFPVWLLGAYLAERVLTQTAPFSVAMTRVATIAASVAIAYIHYKNILHLKWMLPAFGAVSMFWIWAEVKNKKWPDWMERAGRWSYSLYLVHPAAYIGTLPLLASVPMKSISWLLSMTIILLSSYVFYRLIENPSHKLARSVGKRLS